MTYATNPLGIWERDTFEEIGDRMKAREHELRGLTVIDPAAHFVIRVDGRAFHTFTRNLAKPFDANYRLAMKEAAETVLAQMKPAFAYYQSDEISFVFRGRGDGGYQHPFGGKVAKLLSVVASLTSVAFYAAASRLNIVGNGMLPHFDARIAEMCYDPTGALENVMWRENDAMRNSVSMTAQAYFSSKELHGLNVVEMEKRLRQHLNVDWFEFHPSLRRGTYVSMIPKERELTEDERLRIPEDFRPDPGTKFMRSTKAEHFFHNWDMEPRLDALWYKKDDEQN